MFSVILSCTDLAWGDGAVTEESKGDETVEMGGRQGPEQASGISAAP